MLCQNENVFIVQPKFGRCCCPEVFLAFLMAAHSASHSISVSSDFFSSTISNYCPYSTSSLLRIISQSITWLCEIMLHPPFIQTKLCIIHYYWQYDSAKFNYNHFRDDMSCHFLKSKFVFYESRIVVRVLRSRVKKKPYIIVARVL